MLSKARSYNGDVSLIDRFENFIERIMERTFTRAARSHLQPVEIGKRLVRAMESEQEVGMDGVIVPNVYDIFLSKTDFAHFQPMLRSLTRNMEAHVGRVARQRHFQLMSRPVVRFHEQSNMQAGDIRVDPHMQDVDTLHGGEAQHTALLPRIDASVTHAPATPNLLINGETYAVLRSPTKVGRLPDNDIVLNDKRVSRHHAEFLQRGNRWVVRDTGSTNGSAVNNKVVKETALKPGDVISLGGLEITWEQ